MSQIRTVEERLDDVLDSINDELAKGEQIFDERLIQLITDYAQLIIQRSGQIAKEFTFSSKEEIRAIAKRIKALYNTPGELTATITTSALSVIGGFTGCYGGINGSEVAKSLSQGLSAMGQGGSGLASIPRNATDSDKEYSRHLKEALRMKLDQEIEQLRKDDRKVEEVVSKVKDAERSRHDTVSGLLR